MALLEAGRAVTPAEFTEHTPAYQLKYRDHDPEIARTRPIQKQCYACMEYNYTWFVNDLENPYSTPAGKPFTWQRLRVLGRAIAGLGAAELPAERQRFQGGEPATGMTSIGRFRMRILAPWYDIVEKYVGITGAAEGNEMLPDGQFLPPMKMELRRNFAAG